MTREADIAAALDKLRQLPRAELAVRWERVFRCPPPPHTHAPLLLSALAWHVQMQQVEPRSASVASLLRRAKAAAGRPALTPGTRLAREWQGKVHHVVVLAAGFEHDGRTYSSLSAVARAITGTPWSGPKFFGHRA